MDDLVKKFELTYDGATGVYEHAAHCVMSFEFEIGQDSKGPKDGEFFELRLDLGNSYKQVEVTPNRWGEPEKVRIRFAAGDEKRAAIDFFKYMARCLEECA